MLTELSKYRDPRVGLLTALQVENVFMVMWHRYPDPATNRRKVEVTCTPLLRATIGIAHVKSNSTRMNFDKTSRRAYRVMRLAYNIWQFRDDIQ